MLIKLTYYGTSKPTLVNIENVETMFQVVDKYKNRISTKVLFEGGNYIYVEEELQEILKIQWGMSNGNCQDSNWRSPTIDELLETDFYRSKNQLVDDNY